MFWSKTSPTNEIFNLFTDEMFIDNGNDLPTIFRIIILRNNRLRLIIDTVERIGTARSFVKINSGNDGPDASSSRKLGLIRVGANNCFDLEGPNTLLANFWLWYAREMIALVESKVCSVSDCERKFLSAFVGYDLHHPPEHAQ